MSPLITVRSAAVGAPYLSHFRGVLPVVAAVRMKPSPATRISGLILLSYSSFAADSASHPTLPWASTLKPQPANPLRYKSPSIFTDPSNSALIPSLRTLVTSKPSVSAPRIVLTVLPVDGTRKAMWFIVSLFKRSIVAPFTFFADILGAPS